MKPFSSYQEMESLGLQLANEYQKQSKKTKVKCFDVVGFITEYLHLNIEYISFADSSCLGFLSNGKAPVKVLFNGKDHNLIYPENTIVIDKYLLSPSESARLRFTLIHEAAHYILKQHSPSQVSCSFFKSEMDAEIKYSFDDLKTMLSLNECFADRLGAAIILPSDKLKKEITTITGKNKIPVYGDGILAEKEKIVLNRIKDTFGVSYSTVYRRLKDLNLFEQHSFEEYCGGVLGFGIY